MLGAKRQRLSPNTNSTLQKTILAAQNAGAINWSSVAPATIADYLEVLGHSVSSTPEQMFMGFLGVIPGLLGGKTRLIVRSTYKETPMLYSVCLADPGAGKSAACDMTTKPLGECGLQNLIVDKYTQAGLFDHLSNPAHNETGILMSSELGMFLENLLKRQTEGAGERQLFCKLHDGSPWSRVSGNADKVDITNPCVVIGGFSQPEPFVETYIMLTGRNDGFADRLLLTTPPAVALYEEEIDEWNEILESTYRDVKLARVYNFIKEFHAASEREYALNDGAANIYRHFSNGIADQLNAQWKKRESMGKVSKDKKTALRLALNLHVFYFALNEELNMRQPTTVPMLISEQTMSQAVELSKYFAKQRSLYEQCCHDVRDENVETPQEDNKPILRRKVLLHPGPFVKPRNMARRTRNNARTSEIKDVMQELADQGYGTMYLRGTATRAFLKVVPEKLPNSPIVDADDYEEAFYLEDTYIVESEAAVLRNAHPDKELLS